MKITVKENQSEEIQGLSAAYPYAFHDIDLQETKVPWHWHEELEFGYVREGIVRVITPNKTYEFCRDEAFFINTNVLCTMTIGAETDMCLLDSHLFDPVFLGGHFKSVFTTKYMEPVLQNKELELLEIKGETVEQKRLLDKLRELSKLQKTPDMEFQTRNTLSEIWVIVFAEIQNTKVRSVPGKTRYKERVQTMMSFIQQNYMEKLSIENIAAAASVSNRECLRCFQKCLHKTPYDYLLEIRLDTARKLLRETDVPILEIAFQTGFSNGAYFSKIFKMTFGKTPSEARKNFKSF